MNQEKKNALIFTLIPLNIEGIKIKAKALRKRVFFASALSGLSGLSPIPGTSMAVDLGILVEEVYFYINQFKLSVKEIKDLCTGLGIDYKDLESNVLVKHTFFHSICTLNAPLFGLKALVGELSKILLQYLASYITANMVEEGLKSAAFFIPIIGNIIAAIIGAGISYGTTYLSLNSILDAFEKALLDIMEYCFRNRCLEIQTD